MPKLIKISILFIVFCVISITPIKASVDQCSVVVSPTNIAPNSNGNLNFSVTNGESSLVVWVKITSPSGFTINSGSSSGFTSSVDGSSITFTDGDGGFISALNTGDFLLDVSTSSGSQGNFNVQVSDSNDGTNPTTCSGQMAVAISDSPADTTAPNINSDITISNLSDSAATFEFTTDESVSTTIYYGTTQNYGSTVTGEQKTTHSLSISSLNSNTKYYYKIKITDAAGNTTQTQVNNFVTAKSGTTTTITTTVTKTTVTTKEVKDTTLPVVKLLTNLQKSYSKAQELQGTAQDLGGIAKIEFSIDNGVNWNNVDFNDVGAKLVNFNFTPVVFDDGDYKIRLKAYDSAGNFSLSKANVLTIDRLPPSVGGIFYSLGPYQLEQNDEGDFLTLSNFDQKITLSTVGGVNKVVLNINDKEFKLKKDLENNLWSGNINLTDVGKYKITVYAYDSAGNQSQRVLGNIEVLKSATAPQNSDVTVYVYDEELNNFKLWNGNFYGIKNPQIVGENGQFQYILPKGTYYFDVKKSGFRTFKSDIFELKNITIVNPDINLDKLWLGFLNIPSYGEVKFRNEDISEFKETDIVMEEMPDLSFKSGVKEITNFKLRGKPTALVAIDTRFPNTSDQLSVVDELANDQRFNIVPISIQETQSSLTVYTANGGYKSNLFADSDGLLVNPLNIQSLPATYFYDKKGNLTSFKRGIVNKDDMLKNLIN